MSMGCYDLFLEFAVVSSAFSWSLFFSALTILVAGL